MLLDHLHTIVPFLFTAFMVKLSVLTETKQTFVNENVNNQMKVEIKQNLEHE